MVEDPLVSKHLRNKGFTELQRVMPAVWLYEM